MRVAFEFKKLDRRAQKPGRLRGFGGPLFGRAVSPGFAARTDGQVRLATGAGLARDHAAAAEFDVVGMRAEGQQRREFKGVRCRLHRIVQWYRGLQK